MTYYLHENVRVHQAEDGRWHVYLKWFRRWHEYGSYRSEKRARRVAERQSKRENSKAQQYQRYLWNDNEIRREIGDET